MSIELRLGIFGGVMALVGIAITILWPDKKWIGWSCLVFAAVLVIWWITLEVKQYHAGQVIAILAGAVVGGVLAAIIWNSAVSPKREDGPNPSDGKSTGRAALVIEDELGDDPLPGHSKVSLSLKLKNEGAEDAHSLASAYYLFVQPGISVDEIKTAKALKDGMDHFLVQWPALRRVQKLNSEKSSAPARKTIPLFVIEHAISPEDYEEIIQGKKFVVVFGAARYRDSSGVHEIYICRYLQPPFNRINWKRDERYENKSVDIIQAQIPIQVSYDPIVTSLPIHVPAGPNWIVSFTDKVAIEMLWSNGGAINYPPATMIPLRHEQPIGALTITNHGTVPVLNLATDLQFEFRAGAPAIAGDAIRKIVESRNLGYRSLPLAVDSLAPGQSATVFLVNESGYCVVIHPLLQGSIELQGDMNKMEVDFKQRNTTALDKMQEVKVVPVSPYIWKDGKIIGARPISR